MQHVCQPSCVLKCRWHYHHPVGVGFETFLACFFKREIVKAVIVNRLCVQFEVPPVINRAPHTLLHLFPVGFRFLFRHEDDKVAFLVGGKGRGIHVRLVVDGFEHLVHFRQCRFRDIGAFVQHPVNRPYRNAGLFCYIFDGDFFCHLDCLVMIMRHMLFKVQKY